MTFIKLNSILIGTYFIAWLVLDMIFVLTDIRHPNLVWTFVEICMFCSALLVAALLNWKCLGESYRDAKGFYSIFGVIAVSFGTLLLILTLGLWFHFSIGGGI